MAFRSARLPRIRLDALKNRIVAMRTLSVEPNIATQLPDGSSAVRDGYRVEVLHIDPKTGEVSANETLLFGEVLMRLLDDAPVGDHVVGKLVQNTAGGSGYMFWDMADLSAKEEAAYDAFETFQASRR